MPPTREGSGATLVVWTLYRNTLDYPGKLVVRRGVTTGHGFMPDIFPSIVTPATAGNMWKISKLMEMGGLFFLPRQSGDDSVIMGCWI